MLAVNNQKLGKACKEINLEWNSPEKEDIVITVTGGQDWCCTLRFKEHGSIEGLLPFLYNPCAAHDGWNMAAQGPWGSWR